MDNPAYDSGAAYGGAMTVPTSAKPITAESAAVESTALESAGLRQEAEAILRQLVGRDNATLRDDQWTAIEALVLGHRRVLVVQRTGWGKSAVYFVATALLRARGSGPTVIVSPLLALMRDQVAAASRAGIAATTINSANVTDWDDIHQQIAAGDVDVLLCSPERLNNPAFRDQVLPRLAADAGLVVIDEAHCVSDWGHDFRPDYRRIRTFLADLPQGIPVLATTATANKRVTADVAEQLATADHPAGVLVLRGGLDRTSLHLAVVELPDQAARVAWLTRVLPQWDGSGIIYALTVSMAGQIAAQLRAAGIEAQAYTGQTDPSEREALEADLIHNRIKALVATSALGMGFDKPDLAFVVHVGAPSSPISYYQHVGRAGRGVDSAVVVLLPGSEDQRIWDYFGSLAFPQESQVRATLEALNSGGVRSVASLETDVDLRRSRLEMMLKVLDVDGAVTRVQGGWLSTGQPWVYDADRYRRITQARQREQQAMLDYVITRDCRMAFLRSTLDDPELAQDWRCGRCDNCGGVTLPEGPNADEVANTREALAQPGIDLSVRKLWPTGLSKLGLDVTGRIPASEQPTLGRAIARLDGLGWSGPLRELFSAENNDGETPVALRFAAIEVLTSWSSLGKVDGVVAVASHTRPQLVRHLATGLASYLKVPVLGVIQPRAGAENPGRHDINSAMRLASVIKRLELQWMDGAPAPTGLRVLLVDDFVDSGWTLTVAARLLRRAGAAEVLPFALGQR